MPFWWVVFVATVPIACLMVFAFLLGLLDAVVANGDPALVVVYGVGAALTSVCTVGLWRLVHVGAWVGAEGVALRTIDRRQRVIPWTDISAFELRSARISRLLPPRPALHVLLVDGTAERVPELWRGSPIAWGGTSLDEIVRRLRAELEASRPDAA